MASRSRGGMVRFSQEAWAELSKVTWPTRQTIVRLTVIVLVISAIIGLYVLGIDNLFTTLITRGLLGGDSTAPVGP